MPAGRPGPGLDTGSSPHVSSLHKRTEHFAWHLGESPSSGQHRRVCSVIQDFPGNQDVQLPFLFFILSGNCGLRVSQGSVCGRLVVNGVLAAGIGEPLTGARVMSSEW